MIVDLRFFLTSSSGPEDIRISIRTRLDRRKPETLGLQKTSGDRYRMNSALLNDWNWAARKRIGPRARLGLSFMYLSAINPNKHPFL
jgi:hypothetical protein